MTNSREINSLEKLLEKTSPFKTEIFKIKNTNLNQSA